MAVSPTSVRMWRMQWIAIGLATAAIALNYVDRSTLAIGNLKIREEFGINATAIGAWRLVLPSARRFQQRFASPAIGFM